MIKRIWIAAALACLALIPVTTQAQTLTVTLTWTAGVATSILSSDASYDVFRATGACAASQTFTQLNTSPITATTYVDTITQTASAQTYCYQVTGVNSADTTQQSAPSNQVAAVIPAVVLAAPAAPVLAAPVVQ